MYIYIYGSDQVGAMHPPSSKLIWGKKKRKTNKQKTNNNNNKPKEKKCVICFVHVYTSKKTF